MAHESIETQRTWAAEHATRAHELLTIVEAEHAALVAKPTPSSMLSTLAQQRIELAEAHAQVSLALSSAVVPHVGDTPPPPAPAPR